MAVTLDDHGTDPGDVSELAREKRLVLADVEYHTDTTPLDPAEKVEYARLATKFLTIPYCPWSPTEGPQEQFMLNFGKDALYGGAVGGGKSIALLMAASQFLNVPGYEALLLRKTFMDLNRPGALMDIANDWWYGVPGVKFNSQRHAYTFDCHDDSGRVIGHSRIEFGAMDTENDRLKYQGGRYYFVGYDELTQFKERDFTYLFSRMRRVNTGPLAHIPMRMRATSNPGGPGHEWVYKRYIARWERWQKGLQARPKRDFHPATLADNIYLDRDDYIESLMELDPITRQQLMRGDWNIRPDGRMFKRSWFKPVKREEIPGNCQWVRFWDMAATDAVPGLDPDYTVGVLMGRSPDGRFFVADVRRWRRDPGENDEFTRRCAEHDTRRVTQAMEQEPGAGGKIAIHHYRTTSFITSGLRAVPASGKARGRTTTIAAGRKTPPAKIMAAGPLASHADAGLLHVVVDGTWEVDDYISEFEIFPDGEHDDQVDASAGAMNLLTKMPSWGLDIDGANEGQRKANDWRPDGVKNFSMEVTGKILGERIDEARAAAASRDAEREVMNAFAM